MRTRNALVAKLARILPQPERTNQRSVEHHMRRTREKNGAETNRVWSAAQHRNKPQRKSSQTLRVKCGDSVRPSVQPGPRNKFPRWSWRAKKSTTASFVICAYSGTTNSSDSPLGGQRERMPATSAPANGTCYSLPTFPAVTSLFEQRHKGLRKTETTPIPGKLRRSVCNN